MSRETTLVFESWRQLRSTYGKLGAFLNFGDCPLSPKPRACIIQVEYVKKTPRMLDTVFRISIRMQFQLGPPLPQKKIGKTLLLWGLRFERKFKNSGEKNNTSTCREPTCFELRVFGPHRSEGHRLKSYSPPRRHWNPLLHGRTRLKQAPISRMAFPRPKCHGKVALLLSLSRLVFEGVSGGSNVLETLCKKLPALIKTNSGSVPTPVWQTLAALIISPSTGESVILKPPLGKSVSKGSLDE